MLVDVEKRIPREKNLEEKINEEKISRAPRVRVHGSLETARAAPQSSLLSDSL